MNESSQTHAHAFGKARVPGNAHGEATTSESAKALIRLDGVSKVFYTDEVETHALAGETVTALRFPFRDATCSG